jgi:membrane-associated protease RseP (regulator of RpoE activity)
MSRIAEGERKTSSLFSLPTLAIAASAVIVVMVGSIVFYNLRRPAAQENDVVQNPVTATSQQTAAPAPQPVASLPSQNSEQIAQTDSAAVKPTTAPYRDTTKPNHSEPNSNSGGGSITLGQGQTQPIYPQGIRPNIPRSNVNTNEVISPDTIPVQDILGMTGISAEYKNEWLVRGVAKNSIAERSGIRSGDAIMAINDKPLTAETNFHGSGSITSLTVRRDGQSLVLKLK